MWRIGIVRCSLSLSLPFLLPVHNLYHSVTVFYRINQEPPDPNTSHDIERTRQEREFKIGSLGFADSTGILLASILAVPTEIELCRAQLRRGKMLCKGL